MLVAVLLNISIGRFTGLSPWISGIAALAFSILSPLNYILNFSSALNWSIHYSGRKIGECGRQAAQAWNPKHEAAAHYQWPP